MISPNTQGLANINRRVNNVTGHGGTITDRHQELLDAWARFNETREEAREDAKQNLFESLLDPKSNPADLANQYVIAATASSQEFNYVPTEEMASKFLPLIHAEMKQTAPTNYQTIAAQFNELADQLTQRLETVPPTVEAKDLLTHPEKARKSWLEQPILATKLDQLLGALKDAAHLAGAKMENYKSAKHESPGEQQQGALIGLTTTTHGAHRRKVWEAWNDTKGHAGRWEKLHELGCTIEAVELEDHEPYRKPRPIEISYQRTETGGYKQVKIDPEDTAKD